MKRFAMLGLVLLASQLHADTGWYRYRVFPSTERQVRQVADCSLGLFSENVMMGETDIIVGPGQIFQLWKLQMPFTLISELPRPDAWRDIPTNDADYRNEYLRLNDLIAQLETWRAENPDLVERTQIGTAWGNRPVYAYRYYRAEAQDVVMPRKSLVITCGIHAREWISPAVGLHVANRLINTLRNNNDAIAAKLVDNCAVYIVPVLNPDGYDYTWTNNRMWRKNRRNNGSNYGVDLNRNFGVGWGLSSGSSGNTSSETYRGPSAFSEPELRGLRDYSLTLSNIVGFIDFHSYAQKVLWPWSYKTEAPATAAALNALGQSMVQGIADAGGNPYTQGQGSILLYLASGASKDYFYGTFNALSYTIELRDTGTYGFILPEDQITPTQEEGWGAFKKMILGTL